MASETRGYLASVTAIKTYTSTMKVAPEIYKGIEFVRISSLPEDQKQLIKSTLSSDKIIKILKENVLLNDCIQYQDYVQWAADMHKHATIAQASEEKLNGKPAFKVAYK
ncbi:MAG: hypothetical protein AB7K37_01670 [Cyclobacteriaceae bacterium]